MVNTTTVLLGDELCAGEDESAGGLVGATLLAAAQLLTGRSRSLNYAMLFTSERVVYRVTMRSELFGTSVATCEMSRPARKAWSSVLVVVCWAAQRSRSALARRSDKIKTRW